MGAWGFGVFENDKGLDVRDDFEKLVKKHEDGFDAVVELEKEYVDEMDNVNVAMVVAYMAIGFGSLTKTIKEETLQSIDEELDGRAASWSEPEKRRAHLQAFRTYLDSVETVERNNLDNY